MHEFHTDYKAYYEFQLANAEKSVLPYINTHKPIQAGMTMLEIGCGQGSVIKAFANKGVQCVGVEMYDLWLEKAHEWLAEEEKTGQVRLINKNIYDVDPENEFGTKFDFVVLKDVIEHIHDQAKLIGWMKSFLKPDGVIFFGFPPWYMPFGGHQQILNGWLSKTPYWHILPWPVFKGLMKMTKQMNADMIEIKETGISIERFERILKEKNFKIVNSLHWFINPVYEYKFGYKARKQSGFIKSIPFIRNFFTTAVFYIVKAK